MVKEKKVQQKKVITNTKPSLKNTEGKEDKTKLMKPKTQAQELIDKMYSVYNMKNRKEFEIDEDDNIKNDELWDKNRELFESIYKTFAKDTALIAVDEILNYQNQLLKNYKVELKNTFWEQVKQEIEAL